MKNLTIAVLGLLFLGLVSMASGQQLPTKHSTCSGSCAPWVHHKSLVVREADGPFTVPIGTRLVVYALGSTEGVGGTYMDVRIDGQVLRFGKGDLATNMKEIPPLSVGAGSVLEIDDRAVSVSGGVPQANGVALAYLVRN